MNIAERHAGTTKLHKLWRFTYGQSEGDLNLSYRTAEAMRRAQLGCVLLGDLVQLDEAKLLATEGIGRVALKEIKNRLSVMGLRLGMKADPAVRAYLRGRQKEKETATAKEAALPFLNLRYRIFERRGKKLKPFGLYLHDVAKGEPKRGTVITLRWLNATEAYQAKVEAIVWPMTLHVVRQAGGASR